MPYKRRKKDAQSEVAKKKILVAASKSPTSDASNSPTKDSSSIVWKMASSASGDAGTGEFSSSKTIIAFKLFLDLLG